MKLIFIGSGSAFTTGDDNYQSNLFFVGENGDGLLIDCGSDARLALAEQHIPTEQISDVFITHLHADHVGGLEWLALVSYFFINPHRRPRLYISQELVTPLWEHVLAAGLSTIQDFQANLSTYFDVHSIAEGEFTWHGIKFKLVPSIHVVSNHELMPCFGLYYVAGGKRIFMTGDTRFVPDLHSAYYEEADIIFHDCETYEERSGVHAHYTELVTLPPEIKRKTWLYHHGPGILPDAIQDGFLGFVRKGQIFEF
jgi:ribonuclease BN (tRNA processing enzyme)